MDAGCSPQPASLRGLFERGFCCCAQLAFVWGLRPAGPTQANAAVPGAGFAAIAILGFELRGLRPNSRGERVSA